jgi:hypothetical protein
MHVDTRPGKSPVVGCTFELVGDRVVITPPEAADERYIGTFHVDGEPVTPADGRIYYDGLEDAIGGSYYYVEVVPGDAE